MITPCLLRAGLVAVAALSLMACDGEKLEMQERSYAVGLAQPFPAQAKSKAAFPARHQGVFTDTSSGYSLCIGPTAVWRQRQRHETYQCNWQQLDSLRLFLGVNGADSTYQDLSGNWHHLRIIGRDSVRDSWVRCDTVFSLAGPNAGQLRKFQGRYYLNTHPEEADYWQVQRLEIAGRRVVWQRLGQDTLRLRALDTASVHVRRTPGFSLFALRPAPGQQMRRLGDYAGLWETEGVFERQR